jgi:hypothetical protein
VGYWPLDEGSGTIAYDRSGNGNNGTWQGTAAGTNGYYSAGYNQSYAGYFDGSTDYITPPLSANIFANAAPFTVTAWVNQSSLKQDDGILLACVNTVADECLHLAIRNGTPYLGFYSDDISGGMTVTGTWYDVAFVYEGGDGGMRYIYLNGSLVASGQSSSSGLQVSSSTPVIIGADQLGVMSGSIENVHIYNRALSPAEIGALYTAGR